MVPSLLPQTKTIFHEYAWDLRISILTNFYSTSPVESLKILDSDTEVLCQ
jgi:hypothetical protein